MIRKIVCGCFGTIYDANICKDGKMSLRNRRNVTDECIQAVVDHIATLEDFEKHQNAGYLFEQKNKNRRYSLMLFDDEKYKLVPICDDKGEDKERNESHHSFRNPVESGEMSREDYENLRGDRGE